MAAVLRAGAAVGAGIWLAVAALSARPLAAQGFGYAAVAVSPSTLWAGAEKGTTTQASVENGALQYCGSKGAKDCRVLSAVNGCVALAAASTPVPNQFGLASAPTRDGAAAEALAACTKMGGINCVVSLAPCGSDDVRFASPLPLPPGGKPGSVDPALVGLWGLNVNGGIWVWQISVNGTYTVHSEAPDNLPPQTGTFAASNGKYTDHAINAQWDDLGTYTMQGTTAMVMTGKLGTGTWYRIAADPVYGGSSSAPGSAPASRR
jgi:hypothetical protein